MQVCRAFGWFGCMVLAAQLGSVSCVAQTERDACEDGGERAAITGRVTRGKEPTGGRPPAAFPYTVALTLTSDVAIREVTVGGVVAALKDVGRLEWEAQLYEQDLERNRKEDEATLHVEAKDLCGTPYPIDDVVVPLGPAPGLAVTELAVEVVPPMEGECSVPADQRALALVRVTASAASAGAAVTVEASQGALLGSGASKLDLQLRAAGDRAEATTYLVPEKQGSAVVSAYAKGATAPPVVLPVVAAPEISAPTVGLRRAEPHVFTVRSRGNLASCVLEEGVAGAASVTVVDPPLGPIAGAVSVGREPVSCEEVESLRVQVLFAESAPDGATVTLRCFDTYAQEGNATISVAPR
ncbi:hypothetical protein WMF30_51580 [Sorangium sp. So ce134]